LCGEWNGSKSRGAWLRVGSIPTAGTNKIRYLRKGPPDLGGFLFSEENESMVEKNVRRSWVMVNQPSLLTIWAAVTAEVL
jgi:hypothetical protein